MEENKETYKLGSKELDKQLESKYFKFALGQPTNIEVIKEQDVEKKIFEFEEKGEKRLSTKYDLNILVNGEQKLWSVSTKVLTTINYHINNTQKFKIILREKSYDVIPLGLKE